MPPSFDLIEQPFIPCTRLDGSYAEYGLRDVLLKAHEIAEIRDPSPLVTVALHRLLLAILHRCYQGPKRDRDRIAIRSAGKFDVTPINAYFRKWEDRFDLFHEKHPFYQRSGFKQKEPSGINRLAQELSRGNNAALFDHTTDEPPPALSPPQAARVLIAEQAFAVGGGKSDTGNTTHAPLVSGASVLAGGDSLFETLWLNLTIYDGEDRPVACDENDAPCWERKPAQPHKEPSQPRGYLDFLTWQTRTLLLHPEDEDGWVVVRRVSYAQGRKVELPTGFYDPMTAYQRDPKEGDRQVRLSEHRDLWRDSAALFQFEPAHQFKGPTTLHTLGSSGLSDVLPRSARYRVSVFGLCTDKAKVNFWRHEFIPLSLAYLDDASLVASLKSALAMAEACAREALRPAVWVAAANRLTGSADMKPDTDRVSDLVEFYAAERFYWSRLELPFRELLVRLPGEEAHRSACLADWYWETLRPTAIDAYDQSIGQMDAGRDLKAVTAGKSLLYSRLKTIQKTNQIPDREKAGAA